MEPENDLLTASLQKIIEDAADFKIKEFNSGLSCALQAKPILAAVRPSWAVRGLAEGLEEIITNDARFLGETVKLIATPNGVCGFYPKRLAPQLARKAIETNSSAEAIAWLKKVLSTKEATGNNIYVLWNVAVSSKVQLTEEIALVPFSSLPETRQKKLLDDMVSTQNLITAFWNWRLPSAAIVQKQFIEPFLLDGEDLKKEEQTNSRNEAVNSSDALISDTLSAITLAGACDPFFLVKWFNFDDPDLEYAIASIRSSGPSVEIIPLDTGTDILEIDGPAVRELFDQFRNLDSVTKKN